MEASTANQPESGLKDPGPNPGVAAVGEGEEFPPVAPPDPDAPSGVIRDLEEEAGEQPQRSTEDAVRVAAEGGKLTTDEAQRATQWFLSAEPSPAELATKTLMLNFGTEAEVMEIPWVVKPIPMDTMRRIRKEAAESQETRRTGEVDEYMVNLKVIVAATVNPDIPELAKALFRDGRVGSPDPALALRARFQSKPGYIAQIAGEIMSMSGFNSADVREADAAGNS